MSSRLSALIVSAAAAMLAAPVVAQEIAPGRQKAQQMCAVCHGVDGIARVPDAANLAGESVIYLTRQLEAFRSGERTHPQMSIIAQALSDEDIADLAKWYSSLEVSVELPD